jgi:hypothetical protein
MGIAVQAVVALLVGGGLALAAVFVTVHQLEPSTKQNESSLIVYGDNS